MSKVPPSTQSGTTSALLRSPIESRPEIHQLTLPLPPTWGAHDRVTVYLIDRQPLTLIDTGVRSPESRAAVEAALEELGYGLSDLKRVVVTHAHRDHMGLVETLRREGADLECVAHEADAESIERFPEVVRERLADSIVMYREFGVPETLLAEIERVGTDSLAQIDLEGETSRVDRVVRDGDRLEFKDHSLSIHHSPGHSPGHILLEDEAAGLLFCGDLVMAKAIPNTENFYLDALPEPGDRLGRRRRFKGLLELRKSLKRLRSRRFKQLLTGYGGIIRHSDRTIRDTLLYYEVRLQRIDRGLRHLVAMGQEVTAFELCRSLYPSIAFADLLAEPARDVLGRAKARRASTAVDESAIAELSTHLHMAIGALDCLEADGQLGAERRADGVLTYHHL